MPSDANAKITELEAKLAGDPDSMDLRDQLLLLYGAPALFADLRRIEHIVWYVQNHPRAPIARCPMVHIDKQAAPDGFDTVERLWRSLVASSPTDPQLVLGLASFLVESDHAQSMRLLRDFVEVDATVAEVWLDLGRYCKDDAAQRLHYFQQARALGSDQPNLTAWIAHSAIVANDLPAAQAAADQLVTMARHLRDAYGDKLDCDPSGAQRWKRAKELTTNSTEAGKLVGAISSCANHTHWAHTVLGVIAARAQDLDSAIDHLRRSARVSSEPRIASYGPSFALARELCGASQWAAVTAYLQECERFWDVDVLRQMRNDVESQRIPDAWRDDA